MININLKKYQKINKKFKDGNIINNSNKENWKIINQNRKFINIKNINVF